MSALREAAQQAFNALDDLLNGNDQQTPLEQVWNDLKAALAAPQPEPVGEIYRFGKNSAGVAWHGFSVTRDIDLPEGTKLFTAPQPQSPLTDEQIAECERASCGEPSRRCGWANAFARAIERAHKIGGEA
jgi:hypothetical protein